MLPRRTRLAFQIVIVVLVASLVSAAIFIPPHLSRMMSDFTALWNTTDALQHHVAATRQWPQDWDALAPSLASVDPAYSDGDISFAKDRVEVNFEIRFGPPPRPGDWYVQLKSGSMKPEEENANNRLRQLIERLRMTNAWP